MKGKEILWEPGCLQRYIHGLVCFMAILMCGSYISCLPHKSPEGDSVLLPVGLSGPKPEIREDRALTISAERVALTKEYFRLHNEEWYQQIAAREGLDVLSFEPRLIVVHFTALDSLEETLAYFQPDMIASDRGLVSASSSLNVGIQFVVDRDGSIYRSYPETATSRHVIGLNHVAIGIENVGSADLGAEGEGVVALTQAQLEANVALVRYLAGRYASLEYLIGHSEYRELEDVGHPAHALFCEDQASYRTEKNDPGQRFLRSLRKQLHSP